MNYKTIRTYRQYMEARIDAGFLDAQGIDIFIKNESSSTVGGMLTNQSGVELQVSETQYEKAEKILKERDEKYKEYEEVNDFKDDECPFCKSDNIRIDENQPFVGILLSILTIGIVSLLGLPWAGVSKRGYCYECERRWEKKA